MAMLAASYVPATAATFPDGTSKICQLPNGTVVPEVNNPGQNFAGLTQPVPYAPGVAISYNVQMIAGFGNAMAQAVN